MANWGRALAGVMAVSLVVSVVVLNGPAPRAATPSGRNEVVFWHFWGGEDRLVVERLIARFNEAQSEYFVRGVAMPGNNFDLKVFLAVAGGNPPDLINHDDPIVGDWAARGVIQPLRAVATPAELETLRTDLVPAAQRLGDYQGEPFALCNGLDIRALYYNATLLRERGIQPPQTLTELDQLAETITPPSAERASRYGFLPDARRLWAWAPVFGGGFRTNDQGEAVVDTEENVRALEWMMSYRLRYGADNLAAFRQADQSLPGKTFPLLNDRYAVMMDGQWRIRDLRAAQASQRERNLPVIEYGVMPLPPPKNGLPNAGWVNGNIFVVPTGAKQPHGAWAFMRFWLGMGSFTDAAAQICEEGGWIPTLRSTQKSPRFLTYLKREPLFETFVQLAASDHQFPVPVVPGAAFWQREMERVGEQSLGASETRSAQTLLREAEERINAHLLRQRKALRS